MLPLVLLGSVVGALAELAELAAAAAIASPVHTKADIRVGAHVSKHACMGV